MAKTNKIKTESECYKCLGNIENGGVYIDCGKHKEINCVLDSKEVMRAIKTLKTTVACKNYNEYLTYDFGTQKWTILKVKHPHQSR